MNRLIWMSVGFAAVLLLAWITVGRVPEAGRHPSLSEAPTGGDFILDTSAGPFKLREQRGKVVLIYFGYTFCPDVCPTNLALMAQALNALGEEELARVQGVFISVDPERDTPDKLAAYGHHFHPALTGMTGEPEKIGRIAARYGVAYHKVEDESRGGYLVDHSSNTYVVAPDGGLYATLPHGTSPQEILRVVRELLAKNFDDQSVE